MTQTVVAAALVVLGFLGAARATDLSRWLLVTVSVLLGAGLALTGTHSTLGFATMTIAAMASLASLLYLARREHLVRREAERLRTLAKERSDRANVLFHEVRTPLALVKGASELLADQAPGPLNPKQREFMDTITTNCDRVITLAEELLHQARAEAEMFELHLAAVDIRRLARDTVRALRRLHDCEILLDASGAPLLVAADPGLLQQTIINLVNNAVRHAGPQVKIVIRISYCDEYSLVAVSDDGIGMTKQEAIAMFRRFATGPLTGGTGLGMSIARSIVNLHGGRMFTDTIPGRGTTIFFTIPRVTSSSYS